MPTASNPQPYPNPAWGRPSNQAWSEPPPFWHPWGIGRPLAIAALVFLVAAGHIARFLFWPLALAGVVFMVATGRWGGGRRRRWMQANWGQPSGTQDNQGQGNNMWQSSCMPWGRWAGANRTPPAPPTSGNHAFDEYRAETLRRLEEEQTEFSSFLERLRFAKDKAEFDQFMADRRQAPRPPVMPDEPAHG